MKIFIAFSLLILISCGKNDEPKKTDLVFFESVESDFNRYINNKNTPDEPNLLEDITILNNDYPIELALYKDGRWFYNLPRLGEGFGTWKYKDGVIKLFASRILFDMNIDLEATSKNAKEIALRFSDRFGPKVLELENRNID